MTEQEPQKKDFFISYQRKDTQDAEWIAWQLEEAGYTIEFQKWQWAVGSDFAHNMNNALRTCERTIAVLSPNYFKSQYTEAEWESVWGKDVSGERRLLIPVEVAACDEEDYGLLQNRVRVELHGKTEDEARRDLLEGLKPPQKPATSPPFLISTTPKAKATTTPVRFMGELPPIFPRSIFQRNPQFTGRDNELDKLHEQLKQSKLGAITQAVTGLGGVGKTAMAVEYCFRYSHEYDTVLWLHAEEDMTSQYAALADDLGILIPAQETEERIKAVRNWFGQNQKWLLVFDNAVNAKSLKGFQPLGGGWHVIITSRTRGEWRRQELSLQVWDLPTSIEYIQKRLPAETLQEAEQIAKVLGYLPLALSQATAYIDYQKISIAEYLTRLRNPNYNVYDEGEADEYELTIARTWNLSFDAVRERQKANPIPEAVLLALFSILAPDAIPRSIFMQVNSEFEPAMEDWLADLNHYSLIDLQAEELSIHRLVQEMIRRSPTCPDRRASLELTLKAVTSAHPGGDHAQWAECRRMEPHWLECRKGMDAERVVSLDAGLLCNQYGYYLNSQGRYGEAEPL